MNSVRKYIENGLAAAALSACTAVGSEPTEVNDTAFDTNAAVTSVIADASEPVPTEYKTESLALSEVRSLYTKLKAHSEKTYIGSSVTAPTSITFETSTGAQVQAKIIGNGTQIELQIGSKIFYLELNSTIPFEGDCVRTQDSSLCRPERNSATDITKRGLEAAFEVNTESTAIFKAFGITPDMSSEARAKIILQEVTQHL